MCNIEPANGNRTFWFFCYWTNFKAFFEAFQYKFIHQRNTKSLLYHGQNGIIIINLIFEIGENAGCLKAGGCDAYEIYRRTYRSSWKRIARVKSNTLKYKDTTPVRGWANYYAVCGYDSKTKTTGNRSNILLAVLDSPQFTFPTVRDAYVDVLRAVKAGDKIGMIEPMPYGTVNLEYFVF